MAFMQMYRAASRPIKRQFWMTVAMGVFLLAVTVSGQSLMPTSPESSLFTVGNFVILVTFSYGVGMTVQNFRAQGGRIDKIEKFLEETLPETYVRKDVLDVRLGRRESDPVLRK